MSLYKSDISIAQITRVFVAVLLTASYYSLRAEEAEGERSLHSLQVASFSLVVDQEEV